MTFASGAKRHEMSDDVEYIFIDDSEDVGADGPTSKDVALAAEPPLKAPLPATLIS